MGYEYFGSLHSLYMGKNDLWIAATAHVIKAHLFTTDNDFNHLDPSYIKLIMEGMAL